MATADEYAAWIVKNADKKGTPEFDTVAQAYQSARSAAPAASVKVATTNKDYEAGKAKPEWQQGLAAGTNGLLMGFGDEIAGGLGALVDKVRGKPGSLGDNYIANRDTVRGMEAAQRERSPWTTAIGQGLSSLPLTLALPAAAGGLRVSAATPAVAGVGAQALQSAAVGAGLGALSGAGNSMASSAADLAGDALKGGLLSGVLGGAGAPVAAGVGAVGRNVAARMSETAAASFAQQKISQAIARDAKGELATSGLINPLGQAAARFGKLGDEAVIADAGGRNVNQLLDTLATLPGRTKNMASNMLHRRAATSGDRMRDAAETALGTNGQRLGDTVESLITRRETDAAPLYAQLRQTDIQPTPQLAATIEAAEKLGMVKTAREIAIAKQVPFTLDSQQSTRWNMGDLDLIKQGIDHALAGGKAIGKDGKLTPQGASYLELKTKLLSDLDAATTNPQSGASLYAQARAAFENPSKLIDAAEAGKLAITRDEASILGTVKGMSANEMEAFRIGAFEGLRGKLGMQGGRTEIMNLWQNQSTREKLRPIFGSERAYREFTAAVLREAELKKLQSVGVGSQTAARQFGAGDMDKSALPDVGAAVGAAKTGNMLAAAGAARNAWNRVATPERVRDEMGKTLLSRGPDAQRTMNSLAPMVQRINGQNLLLSNGVGVMGNNLTNQMNNQLLPPQP